MKLENSFTVPLPVDEAWHVLGDIERVAPLLPGAALDSVAGDDFAGRVKLKLGPINLTYQGTATIVERDQAGHRAVVTAQGKDQRGNGTAKATITSTLTAEGGSTRVDVVTDLDITGRPAQFGRGVMTDVTAKLLGQFADKLGAELAAEGSGPVDRAAAERSQEPTVAGAAKAVPAAGRAAAAKAAATVAGVVEEVAAAAEGTPVEKAAAPAKKAAAAVADKAAGAERSARADTASAAEAPNPAAASAAAPAKKAPAAKKTTPATTTAAQAAPATTTAAQTAPAKTTPADTAPAKAAPAKAARSQPTAPASEAADQAPAAADTAPAASTAPPTVPAPVVTPPTPITSARSAPTRSAATPAPEPAPIDALQVGASAMASRYAVPAAGVAAAVLVLGLVRWLRNR